MPTYTPIQPTPRQAQPALSATAAPTVPPENDTVLDQRLRDVFDTIGAVFYAARRKTYLPGDPGYETHGPHDVDDAIAAVEALGLEKLHRGRARVVFRVPRQYTGRSLVVKFPLAQSTDVWTDGVVQNHNEARRLELCAEPDIFESYIAPVFDYHPAYAWLVQLEGETYEQGFENPEAGMRAASRIQQGLLGHGLPGEELDTGRGNIASFGGEDLIIDFGWWSLYDETRNYTRLQQTAHAAFSEQAAPVSDRVADQHSFGDSITLPEPDTRYSGDTA